MQQDCLSKMQCQDNNNPLSLHEATSIQGISLLYMVETAAEVQVVDTINRSADY